MAESERAAIEEAILPFARRSVDARIVKGVRQWRQENLAFFDTAFGLYRRDI
jgi:hypothetical protein